ncbi:hypothetical protein [Sediminicola luteus]|uniref:Uncharacterized protein n=1 Tax=Sediminicola luteus TaxID=319238 RepID=A0A2A4GEZ9_9FLAO|nr:hypothetical protein [Sediminicola luteus]PCE66578.1 hypothetical protein B7P33_04580 [Sediminicola luteus]
MLLLFMTLGLIGCSKDSGEGPEGMEGNGGEEGSETGVLWNIDQDADETLNGLRLQIRWDAASSSFTGTLTNTNTTTMPATRFEVHVFDANNKSTEYGPSPSVDMAPSTTRNISLQLPTNVQFVKYNMHPEFGSAGNGG